jgi:hypothetical protein
LLSSNVFLHIGPICTSSDQQSYHCQQRHTELSISTILSSFSIIGVIISLILLALILFALLQLSVISSTWFLVVLRPRAHQGNWQPQRNRDFRELLSACVQHM